MKKQIKLSKLPTFDSNPFIEHAIEKIHENSTSKFRWIKGNHVVHNYIENKEKEIIAQAAFLQKIEVDEDKFAKLYLSQLGIFFDLPNAGMKVFTYILNTLPPRSDRFFIVMKEALLFTGYKEEKSIFTGLACLCERGLIARSETHYMYYINPMVFFNGDRITFAKTYVKKRKVKSLDHPNQQFIDFGNTLNDFENETSENTTIE